VTLTDTLIAAREILLHFLLRVRSDEVLNPEPSGQTPIDAAQVAAGVKRAVNAFKAAGMDPSGGRVDYTSLRNSAAYTDYRQHCTPLLRSVALATLTTREVHLSSILRWYARDFTDVTGFMLHHLPDDERRAWLRANQSVARFVYTPYNWTLNT